MPHHPDDDRHVHLQLIREEPTPPRRKSQGFQPPSAPNRGGRAKFASELRDRIDDFETEIAARPPSPAGIQPHLVFRVPLSPTASTQSIAEFVEKLGISVVSIEADNAIIAFRDDANLAEFRAAVQAYEQGPQSGINPRTGQPYSMTKWDVLEHIEAAEMRLWDRQDRIGRRLLHIIGDEGQSIHDDQLYVVDVELWHRGTDVLARAGVQELRQLVMDSPLDGERLCDSFIGQLLCLSRLAVRGRKMRALLDLDIVAELDVPPQPTFDHRQALRATERQFPTPPVPEPGGPTVAVVDSGIVSNHPLLASNVGHAVSVMTSTESSADENGHGSLVSGIAVFGNIRACYESGQFSSPITLFSARALNAENRFDDQTLIIHQMRRAIQTFVAPPYECRVYNLSLGDDSRAWLEHNPRQSIWAESLDILAREFNVVLVLSAGNQPLGLARTASDSEEVLATYPDYLFEPFAGLGEPATAAIPITVGGIAEHDIPAVPVPRRSEDIIRTIALAGEPTPTARIGPGLNGAIKPEFVASAGNVAFQGFSEFRQVDDNHGLSVMSLSHQPTQNLITSTNAKPFRIRRRNQLRRTVCCTLSIDSIGKPSSVPRRRT